MAPTVDRARDSRGRDRGPRADAGPGGGLRATLVGVAGAALLAVPAHHFRIDEVQCSAWPSRLTAAGAFTIYLGAIALLTLSWWGMVRAASRARWPLTLRRVLVLGAIVHLVALASPPFLSRDPICYAAIGRAQATFHHSAYTPLRVALPATDPFLSLLSESYRREPSNYMPGFHALAWAIARVAGDDLALSLTLYQLVGLIAILAAAAVAGRAAGARAAALVLFCPLSIIEATVSGHNDALLALSVALFVLAVTRRRPLPALLALGSALLVKASALLLLLLYVLTLGLRRMSARPRPLGTAPLLALLATALALGAAALAVLWPMVERYALMIVKLVGPPTHAMVFCTRSLECLPRAALHFLIEAPLAAWVLGLVFRAAAVALLIAVALRSAAERRPLTWAGTFLFLYFLYFHAYSQSWYLLSLLPLLCHADPRLYRAMLAFCVTLSAYYALEIPFDCDLRPVTVGTTEVLQGLWVIVPPTLLLLRRRGEPRGTIGAMTGTRNRDERPTKVYTRCEACGTIARPKPDGSLPDGWIALAETARSNAPRAACSAACAEQLARAE
jgi:hypothetical protein